MVQLTVLILFCVLLPTHSIRLFGRKITASNWSVVELDLNGGTSIIATDVIHDADYSLYPPAFDNATSYYILGNVVPPKVLFTNVNVFGQYFTMDLKCLYNLCNQITAMASYNGTLYVLLSAANTGYAEMLSINITSRSSSTSYIFDLPRNYYWDYSVPMTHFTKTIKTAISSSESDESIILVHTFITSIYQVLSDGDVISWIVNITVDNNIHITILDNSEWTNLWYIGRYSNFKDSEGGCSTGDTHCADTASYSRLIGFTSSNALYSITVDDNLHWTSKLIASFPCFGTAQFIGNIAIDVKQAVAYLLSPCPYDSTIHIYYLNGTQHFAISDQFSEISQIALTQSLPYPPKCGISCAVNTDCSNSQCSYCRIGKCVDNGDCGAFCLNGTDCYAGNCVGRCVQNKCSSLYTPIKEV